MQFMFVPCGLGDVGFGGEQLVAHLDGDVQEVGFELVRVGLQVHCVRILVHCLDLQYFGDGVVDVEDGVIHVEIGDVGCGFDHCFEDFDGVARGIGQDGGLVDVVDTDGVVLVAQVDVAFPLPVVGQGAEVVVVVVEGVDFVEILVGDVGGAVLGEDVGIVTGKQIGRAHV